MPIGTEDEGASMSDYWQFHYEDKPAARPMTAYRAFALKPLRLLAFLNGLSALGRSQCRMRCRLRPVLQFGLLAKYFPKSNHPPTKWLYYAILQAAGKADPSGLFCPYHRVEPDQKRQLADRVSEEGVCESTRLPSLYLR